MVDPLPFHFDMHFVMNHIGMGCVGNSDLAYQLFYRLYSKMIVNFIFEPGMEKTGLKGGGLDDLLSLLCNFERYLTMCLSTAYHKDLMLTRLIKKPYSVFLAADNSNLILPKFHLFCYRR